MSGRHEDTINVANKSGASKRLMLGVQLLLEHLA